jgi:hypothetical protein
MLRWKDTPFLTTPFVLYRYYMKKTSEQTRQKIAGFSQRVSVVRLSVDKIKKKGYII